MRRKKLTLWEWVALIGLLLLFALARWQDARLKEVPLPEQLQKKILERVGREPLTPT